ncbi:MAG TPA: single-stranded DNA-binding protein [Chloroflexota bacterium]|jgi:single-strand DNA-binding protein
MLRVTLLGNLGADPEVRFTQKGGQFVQFRVAVNQVRMGADGERQENTEWFRVRVMGRQQEYAQKLGKGNRVLVIGRLDIGHYQSKDGEARVSYDVWADDIQTVSVPGTRAFGADMDGPDVEAEAGAEPAAAGVSSLNGNGAGSTPGRGRAPRGGDGASRGGAARDEDLEDLPF